MGKGWRYWRSFIAEEVLERTQSPYNPVLEVWYVYGRKILNAENVNLSFGELDRVFRVAFQKLQVRQRPIHKVLLLGLGVGNIPAILAEHRRNYAITGVEIDPEVIRLGRNHFGLDDYEDVQVVNADAIDYVVQCQEQFDLIVVDLFVDALVPPGAEQSGFLLRLAELLSPQGLLLFNRLMHSPGLREQSEAFTRMMKAVLPGTQYIKAHKNRMLYYEKTPPS